MNASCCCVWSWIKIKLSMYTYHRKFDVRNVFIEDAWVEIENCACLQKKQERMSTGVHSGLFKHEA